MEMNLLWSEMEDSHQNGVRQVCVLSLLLSIVDFDEIRRETTQTTRGIQWIVYRRLEELDFAHVLNTLAESTASK